ncbi:hypothetical protein SAMN05444161_5991 [Rhizobiales bacterium GAS191]|jgi:hypothetical protein|nr:hypothetical protein SAMN05519103_05161 [Rhizobiales bacterium GAS113]SEE50837.1 hypothetical protein SAMN05444161_5991 [Rhizobiales bacterium GAS191]
MRMQDIRRILAACGALIGWFALSLQLGLLIRVMTERGLTIADALIVYFGFFTVLTNILVALVLSATVVRPLGPGLLTQPRLQSAVAVYIAMTGLIYSLLLRRVLAPQSPQFLVETLLHDVIPPLYVLFWAAFVPKGMLRWGDAFKWLVYPAGYFVYILGRGALIGRYPYPFLDAHALGAARLAGNAALLLAAFLAAGLICVAIDRALSRLSVSASASPARRSASG